jgi:hypothetical protein
MSRSRRRAPYCSFTSAHSEKRDKVATHWRERRRVHAALHAAALACVQPTDTAPAAPDLLLPHTRELSNVWAYAKDGKQYLGAHPGPELLRYLRK